jgi:hypothetical protein
VRTIGGMIEVNRNKAIWRRQEKDKVSVSKEQGKERDIHKDERRRPKGLGLALASL